MPVTTSSPPRPDGRTMLQYYRKAKDRKSGESVMRRLLRGSSLNLQTHFPSICYPFAARFQGAFASGTTVLNSPPPRSAHPFAAHFHADLRTPHGLASREMLAQW